MKNLKILSLPVDRGGCGWYRVRQPFDMIKRFTNADTGIIENDEDSVSHMKALQVADIAVVRQGGEAGIPNLKAIPEFKHLKWVLDIDDNIELISPYSEHYGEYGMQEFYDENSKQWVWKNGEKGFDVIRNRERVLSLMVGLKEADMVTVTTPRLRDYALQYNKNVVVLPNSINPERWWQLPLTESKQLRVGWSGGVSHYEDWFAIKEPLNKLLRKYKFKLIMVGAHFPGIVDSDLKHLVEVHPWVPFEAHSYRMMCLNLDIAIIPLADLPFNHFKSSVKFYEMSAMGIPSVVSSVPPYSDDLSLDNSSPYGTPSGFEYALESLLTSKEERERIGKNAYDWVQSKYNAQKNAKLWVDAYSTLVDKQK